MESLVTALSKMDLGARQEEDKFLEDSSSQQGFCPLLLKIAVDRTVDFPPQIRLSAAVYLKNTISRLWNGRTDKEGDFTYVISPEDKQLMREDIIDALVLTKDNTVRRPLCHCLELISRSDFPKFWPDLVARLRGYLETDSMEQWRGAALAVYQVGRKYQFRQDSERGEFLGLIQTLLPILYQRCSLLIEQESDQSYYIQHFIFKSIYYVINCHLPLSLFQDHVFHQWFPLWFSVISKPVPPQDGTMDVQTRAGAQWWKCKKWALRTLLQLFEKYSDVEQKYVEFEKFFTQHYSEKVVTLILQQLDQHTKGILLTDATLQISLSYLTHSTSNSVSWELIRPHFEPLFLSLIFPLMCHSQKDQVMWDEDLIKYIRIRFSKFDDFLSPVSAAESLIQGCVRKDRGILDLVLQHCMRVLGANQDEWDAQRTDGALHILSCACDVINEHEAYKLKVESLYVRYVFPLFPFHVPYLRARACWMFHRFDDFEFSDVHNLSLAIQGLMRCLIGEKELPVRMEAAIGVLSLFKGNEESVNLLKPHVGTFLRELLLLVKETDNEDIADALRDIIRIYGEEISGIAVELCASLVQTFSEIYDIGKEAADKGEDEDQRDDGEFSNSLVGTGILNAILSLCTAMSNNLQLLSQLENCISQLLAYLLRTGVIDLYEEVFQILKILTDEQVSSGMWGMLFLILECLQWNRVDYFQSMMPFLYNYVCVDKDTFLSDPKYMESVLQMCADVLEKSEEEISQQYACKMLEVVLLNLKGKVDQWLPAILTPPMLKLRQTADSPKLRSQCLIVVIAALFTSPHPVLQLLESTTFPNCQESVTSQLLASWIENPDQFDGIHDRKVSVLALCSLLQCASAPQLLKFQQLAPNMLHYMVQMLNQLVRAYEKNGWNHIRKDSDAKGIFDDSGENSEAGNPEVIGGEEEISDSTDLESETLQNTDTECEYETLVDVEIDYDEFVAFKALLQSPHQQNAPIYSLLVSQMSIELQEQIQNIFKVSGQHCKKI